MNERLLANFARLRRAVASFVRRDEAPTAAEYAIMAGLIGAVIVATVIVVGANVVPLFEAVHTGFQQ